MRHLLLLVSACTLAAQPNAGVGSIEGHVVNSLTGEAVRKATVTLTSSQLRLIDDTDAAGKFRFAGLPPGTYRLLARRAGFQDHASRRPVSLGENEDSAGCEIRLPPKGVTAGRSLDEDDDPSPGAMVWIFKQVYREGKRQWDRLSLSYLTNDGEYRFLRLGRGDTFFAPKTGAHSRITPTASIPKRFTHRPTIPTRLNNRMPCPSIWDQARISARSTFTCPRVPCRPVFTSEEKWSAHQRVRPSVSRYTAAMNRTATEAGRPIPRIMRSM
jgi:Carboxypeptidase regulatory-like domain